MSEPFTHADARAIAVALAVVAEPTRLRIAYLLASGPKSVGAVATALGLVMQTVSHHLNEMRAAGLLVSGRAGRYTEYRLNPARFAPAALPGVPGRQDAGRLRVTFAAVAPTFLPTAAK